MKGDPLPGEDHVARHCEKRFFFDGESIGPGNFELRKHEYLSVNWLEKYGQGDIAQRLAHLRKFFTERKVRRIGPKDQFAVLNVDRTLQLVYEKSVPRGRKIRVLHEPIEFPVEKADEGHSGIHDTAVDERQIALLLVEASTAYPGK